MSVEFLKVAPEEHGGDPEDYGTVLYNSGWKSDGKWQHCTVIVEIGEVQAAKHTAESPELPPCEQGTYAVHAARCGSYFTDYEYNEPFIEKVETYIENVPTLKWMVLK